MDRPAPPAGVVGHRQAAARPEVVRGRHGSTLTAAVGPSASRAAGQAHITAGSATCRGVWRMRATRPGGRAGRYHAVTAFHTQAVMLLLRRRSASGPTPKRNASACRGRPPCPPAAIIDDVSYRSSASAGPYWPADAFGSGFPWRSGLARWRCPLPSCPRTAVTLPVQGGRSSPGSRHGAGAAARLSREGCRPARRGRGCRR